MTIQKEIVHLVNQKKIEEDVNIEVNQMKKENLVLI